MKSRGKFFQKITTKLIVIKYFLFIIPYKSMIYKINKNT